MHRENDSRFAAIEDCIEECYIASKLCYDKADGTPVCPFDYQKCVDDCQKRFSSQTTGIHYHSEPACFIHKKVRSCTARPFVNVHRIQFQLFASGGNPTYVT